MTLRIYIADVRAAGYCPAAARLWCRRHGLDWDAFRREGLPASIAESIGDEGAVKTAKYVREREDGRRR